MVTSNCSVTFSAPAPALTVTLTCPDQVIFGTGSAMVSVGSNSESAVVTLEALDAESQPSAAITLDQTGSMATVDVDSPQGVVVRATAVDGESTVIDRCSIGFVGIAQEATRAPFASQCAQAVISCTTSFPVAEMTVAAGDGQTVTATGDGFIVEGSGSEGFEIVALDGSASQPSENAGQANEIFYSWTFGATDDNQCLLAPGTEFSTEEAVSVAMDDGFHLIRLTVENEQMIDPPDTCTDQDGTNISISRPKFDFVEMLIEVR
jgi:hypothetical protein